MPHFLSLTGGSGLGMQTLLQCPRKFQLIMDGWEPEKTELYFVEGIVYHKYAVPVMLDMEIDNSKITEIFTAGEFKDENKDKIIKFDITTPGTKGRTAAEQAGERIIRSLDKLKEIKATGRFGEVNEENLERLIEIDLLIDPLTQKPDDDSKRLRDNDIIFTARLDIVNDVGVQDFKQCKISKPKEEQIKKIEANGSLPAFGKYNAEKDFQLSEYGYMQTVTEGYLIENVYYHLFSKHETGCIYVPLHGTRTVFDYHHAFNSMKRAGNIFLDCEKNGYEREGMIRCNCREQYGQECRYWKHCRGGIDLMDIEELEKRNVG